MFSSGLTRHKIATRANGVARVSNAPAISDTPLAPSLQEETGDGAQLLEWPNRRARASAASAEGLCRGGLVVGAPALVGGGEAFVLKLNQAGGNCASRTCR